jgi:hypothetical protein
MGFGQKNEKSSIFFEMAGQWDYSREKCPEAGSK